MAKKKKQPPRCPVEGCQKRLTEAFAARCAKCDKLVVCKYVSLSLSVSNEMSHPLR